MKHIFIINPHAGKKDQTARIYDMADRLRERHGLDCACIHKYFSANRAGECNHKFHPA